MASPPKPDILFSLSELFQRKKWDLSTGSSINLSLFEKFSERLKVFSYDEQKLIIELTEDFVRIGLSEYLTRFYNSFKLLGQDFIYDHQKIFIYPLIEPYITTKIKTQKVPRGKTKSAAFLHYMLEADDWPVVARNLILDNSIKRLSTDFNPDNCCLILVDDFVGTGQTAHDVCKVFLDEKFPWGELSKNKIKVVSIAAQKEGIDFVNETLNIEVVADIVVPKGISDRYNGKILESKRSGMEGIERKLNILNDYQFGFGRSEALITFLNKTPNNTFPVYWHETRTQVAPFPRYKKFQI